MLFSETIGFEPLQALECNLNGPAVQIWLLTLLTWNTNPNYRTITELWATGSSWEDVIERVKEHPGRWVNTLIFFLVDLQGLWSMERGTKCGKHHFDLSVMSMSHHPQLLLLYCSPNTSTARSSSQWWLLEARSRWRTNHNWSTDSRSLDSREKLIWRRQRRSSCWLPTMGSTPIFMLLIPFTWDVW